MPLFPQHLRLDHGGGRRVRSVAQIVVCLYLCFLTITISVAGLGPKSLLHLSSLMISEVAIYRVIIYIQL